MPPLGELPLQFLDAGQEVAIGQVPSGRRGLIRVNETTCERWFASDVSAGAPMAAVTDAHEMQTSTGSTVDPS